MGLQHHGTEAVIMSFFRNGAIAFKAIHLPEESGDYILQSLQLKKELSGSVYGIKCHFIFTAF